MRVTAVAFVSSLSISLLATAASAQPTTTTGTTPASTTPTSTTPASGTTSAPVPAPTPSTGTTPSSTTTGTAATPTPVPGTPAPAIDPATVPPEQMPTAIRMRRLEQRTQALKERTWQLKARVAMLKEQLVTGGTGSQTAISHANEMGTSFRLASLVYTLDGTQVFARSDASGESLYKTKSFDIFVGPIAPGSHSLAVVATYKGHGYGVFEYLTKYTFTARSTQSFVAGEGQITNVDCHGVEKGGPTTPLEKRPALTCTVTQVAPQATPAATSPTPAAAPTTTTTPGT